MAAEILTTPTQGKRYKVVSDDRITFIAAKAGITPSLIIDANAFLIPRRESREKLPTIFPGDILQIPVDQVSERPKRKQKEKIRFKKKTDFTLVIDGYEIPVESGKFTRTMNTLANEFEATIAWVRGADPVLDKKTKIGSDPDCQLYLGEDLVLDGYIPNITQIGGMKPVKRFIGFSKTVHLVDTMLRPPYSKSNISLEQRCQDLAFPFGVDVVVSDAAKNSINGQFKRVSGKPDQKAFDHLLKLARQRGALLRDDKFGNLLIDVAKTSGDSIGIIKETPGGRATETFQFQIDNRKRFQTYRAIGQTPKSNTNSGIIKDDSISQPRLATFQADEADSGDLNKSAIWRKNKTIADAYSAPIPVADWYTSETQILWPVNEIITVESDTMEIPEGKQLLIQKVEFIFGDKISAILHPVPLFAYSTEEIKTEEKMNEAVTG